MSVPRWRLLSKCLSRSRVAWPLTYLLDCCGRGQRDVHGGPRRTHRPHAHGACQGQLSGRRRDGALWSAERARTSSAASDENDGSSSPERWTLTAEIGNAIIARANVRRRAVAADVRVVPVPADGLVGVFDGTLRACGWHARRPGEARRWYTVRRDWRHNVRSRMCRRCLRAPRNAASGTVLA
jgi:hypothetical protein